MENKITKIEVIGSGCANCDKLRLLAIEAAKELGLGVEVDYSNDVQKALAMGVMRMPVLVVNGQPALTGPVSDIKKVKEALSGASDDCGCSGDHQCHCGGCGC